MLTFERLSFVVTETRPAQRVGGFLNESKKWVTGMKVCATAHARDCVRARECVRGVGTGREGQEGRGRVWADGDPINELTQCQERGWSWDADVFCRVPVPDSERGP